MLAMMKKSKKNQCLYKCNYVWLILIIIFNSCPLYITNYDKFWRLHICTKTIITKIQEYFLQYRRSLFSNISEYIFRTLSPPLLFGNIYTNIFIQDENQTLYKKTNYYSKQCTLYFIFFYYFEVYFNCNKKMQLYFIINFSKSILFFAKYTFFIIQKLNFVFRIFFI